MNAMQAVIFLKEKRRVGGYNIDVLPYLSNTADIESQLPDRYAHSDAIPAIARLG